MSASELFALADQVIALQKRATQLSQHEVQVCMDSALTYTMSAAKSAAFNEAQEAYKERATVLPGEEGKR